MKRYQISRIATVLALPLLFAQSSDSIASLIGPSQSLGQVHFPISCSATAQKQFDQALTLLHNFFFPRANEAFAAIAELEPSCAMAYWGIAISERLNPLAEPTPFPALQRGLKAIDQARARSMTASWRERAWIEAQAAFFVDFDRVDHKTRTLRYEEKMAELHARFPSDAEGAIFYALALDEAADPSDKTFYKQLQAATILEGLETNYPDHPGIPHYIIHSYDYPELAQLGLFAAMRCVQISPAAPHAQHMPSHIFSMLGMWHDVIRTDLAADAAVKTLALEMFPLAGTVQAANPGRYHSLDFLTNAYLQLGQDRRAAEIVAMRNSATETFRSDQFTANMAFAAIPVRYAFERGAWEEAAKLSLAPTPYPAAEAVTWFGRAMGSARNGDTSAAKSDLSYLQEIEKKLLATSDTYWERQVQIQENAVTAWIALAEGDKDKAIGLMEEAADLEDQTTKNIAMENRLSPMRELLGELLLQAGEPKRALTEFETSLGTLPNRYRSIAGALNAANQINDMTKVQTYSAQIVSLLATADSNRSALDIARQRLAVH